MNTKIIKRYQNRKLYDTTTTKYTSLKELQHEIKNGTNIRVIDNKSKSDITVMTLSLIFQLAQQKHLNGLNENTLLESIRAL